MSRPITEYERTISMHRYADAKTMEADIKAVMETPEGRRLFLSIVFAGGVYTHSNRDDNVAYLTGRRDAALEVMAKVNMYAPELVLLARKERNDLIAGRNRQLEEIRNQQKRKEEDHA